MQIKFLRVKVVKLPKVCGQALYIQTTIIKYIDYRVLGGMTYEKVPSWSVKQFKCRVWKLKIGL